MAPAAAPAGASARRTRRGALAWLAGWCACAGAPAPGAADEGPAAPAVSAGCRAALAAHVELEPAGVPDGAPGADLLEARGELRTAIHAMPLSEATACAEAALRFGASRPVAVARLVEQVATHVECAAQLATKSEAQTRCAQKWYKIAIHALAVAGRTDAAEAMWHRATRLRTKSSAATARIGWPSIAQTPTVWISSLESAKVWNCSHWPFVERLEANAPLILEEILSVAKNFSVAYPYLTRGGTWQDLFLYRGHEWDAALCGALPRTCRLLLPELPTKPGVPYATQYNEEVVIFRSEPGASVGAHCGSSNAVVNIHFTLMGGRGTSLRIGADDFPLQDGRAFCFQDSYFHAIEHRGDGAKERISLVVRVMHPQLSLAAYGSSSGTDVVEDLARWDQAVALRREVDRLRQAYRELAAQTDQAGGAASCRATSAGCAAPG